LTIKLTRHVAPALACRGSLTVRIIRLSTIRSLEQNLRTTRVATRSNFGTNRTAFCQLLQLSKSVGPGYRPERSAPGGTFEKLSNRK